MTIHQILDMCVPLLCFFTLTAALSLPPNQAIRKPGAVSATPNGPAISPSTSPQYASNLNSLSPVTLDDLGILDDPSSMAAPVCNGSILGENLNLHSCWDAHNQIVSLGNTQFSFGERDTGTYDILLPRRFMSCKSLVLS